MDVQRKLNDALLKTLNDPQVKAKLFAQGVDPKPSAPEYFSKFIANEKQRWATLLKSIGVVAN